MHGNAVEIRPGHRRKTALVTYDSIDGRTHAARQVRGMVRALQKQLGRKATVLETATMKRCAALTAIAEDARVRFLRGDKSVSYDDVVRADGVARRAMRDLQATFGRKPRRSELGIDAGIAAIFNGDANG